MIDKYLEEIVKTIDINKGEDISVLNIAPQTSIADYFVICTALNKPHAQSIAHKIDKSLSNLAYKLLREEGVREGEWILQDYGDIIVQIFQKEIRTYYDLDKLWQDAERIDISHLLV